MMYCCEGCGFLFRRLGEVKECPSCESPRLRPATEEETEQLKAVLNDNKKESDCPP